MAENTRRRRKLPRKVLALILADVQAAPASDGAEAPPIRGDRFWICAKCDIGNFHAGDTCLLCNEPTPPNTSVLWSAWNA